jgi:hypothetical protein
VDWGMRNVSTHLTKDIPEANKVFSHVIIQKDVVRADYAGIGYFHFNR